MKTRTLFLIISALYMAVGTLAQSHSSSAISEYINNNCGGYYEFLPAGYSDPANVSIMYPLLIDVQGTGAQGDGSPAQLAKLLKYGAAYYISRGEFPNEISVNGHSHALIVISAQFKQRGAGSDIADLIDFLSGRYRIDSNRIYLTGFSSGGEPVWQYPCIEASHSNTIAALVPVSGVNTNKWFKGVDNIVSSALPVWALHSKDDDVAMTPMENSLNFVNKINELNPAVPATFTMLTGSHSETWSQVYDPAIRYDVNGKNVNIYEWMLQYNRVANVLPVKMISYSVSFSNQEDVIVKWQTAQELHNDFFVIERSLNGEQFEEAATIAGGLNNGNGATYTWIDQSPVHGKSWYRLSQIDKDGKKQYFDIKEIVIQNRKSSTKIYPTLVRDNTIKVALSSGNKGVARFRIIDMNGAVLHESNISSGGGTIIQLTLNKWSQGLHVVEVNWNGNTERVKIMKM